MTCSLQPSVCEISVGWQTGYYIWPDGLFASRERKTDGRVPTKRRALTAYTARLKCGYLIHTLFPGPPKSGKIKK